ncbi:MAG: hypothetical protein ACI87W_002056 [Halieaceae bacterium]|jgi:hypothetical protein
MSSTATATVDAIPSGVEDVRFLSDPVTDQLVRVVMERGAALWVERRRTRTLERVLLSTGVIAADAMEQWLNEPTDEEAEREELDQWMQRIYGTLANIGPAPSQGGAEQ